MRLNLETKSKEQELVKAYLEKTQAKRLQRKSTTARLLKRTERLLSTKKRWTAL